MATRVRGRVDGQRFLVRVKRRGYGAGTWGNVWIVVKNDRVAQYYAAY